MKLPDGVTYRQLHYWVNQEYLPPDLAAHLTPGSGNKRQWTPEMLRMLTIMGRLRLAGLEAAQAGRIATLARYSDDSVISADLAPGVGVVVDLGAVLDPTTASAAAMPASARSSPSSSLKEKMTTTTRKPRSSKV